MTSQSQKILSDFQVRKSKPQKSAFRAWLCQELESAGYHPKIEKGFAARNVVIGDPDTARIIFSAHYDTCAVLPFPNFITPRNMLFYVLYQLCILIPLFLAVAIAEGILLAVTEALGVWQLVVLAPVLSIALCALFIWWILDGPANRHTANDNTSGVVTLLETALALPPEDRSKVCFVFFDNEEKGLFGSAAFTKAHKKAKKEALNINFDCVSDGDYIQFFPDNRMKKKDADTLKRIETAFQSRGQKQTEVVRGSGFYPSDNKAFRRGVGVCALKKKKIVGYYMDRIHTKKDTVFQEENIALLRDGALALAAMSENKEDNTHEI